MAASGSSSQIRPTVQAVVSLTTTLGSFISSISVGMACTQWPSSHTSSWQLAQPGSNYNLESKLGSNYSLEVNVNLQFTARLPPPN